VKEKRGLEERGSSLVSVSSFRFYILYWLLKKKKLTLEVRKRGEKDRSPPGQLVEINTTQHTRTRGRKFPLVLWRDETKLPRHTIKTRRLTHTRKRSISSLSFFFPINIITASNDIPPNERETNLWPAYD
jgi:hypothetical protein